MSRIQRSPGDDGDDGDDESIPCPKCLVVGGFYRGYGLMGGGCGAYEGCDNCGYWHKTQDEGSEATPGG